MEDCNKLTLVLSTITRLLIYILLCFIKVERIKKATKTIESNNYYDYSYVYTLYIFIFIPIHLWTKACPLDYPMRQMNK